MRIYVVWQKNTQNVAIMDISNMVDYVQQEQPELDRVVSANAILNLVEGDFIMTADSEEQMLENFPNAEVVYEKEMN